MNTAIADKEVVRLKLFTPQGEFIASQSPFMAFIGGRGSGKTRGGAYKALLSCVNHPGVLGIIAAPNYRMLTRSTLREVLMEFPGTLTRGKDGKIQFNKQDMHLRMNNGSEIIFASCDDPESLRGPSAGFFWIDEAAQVDYSAWLILQATLRQAGIPHQGWITTTPKGHNWVYTEFVGQEREEYKVFRGSSRDNPHLSADFIRRLEESYEKEYALQEIEGEFVVLSGKCYFDGATLQSLLEDCRPPKEDRGIIKVWKAPVTARRYVMGVDVAQGVGGDASCAVIFDWRTGELVAALHSNLIALDELGVQVVKLAQEYNDAYLGVENNFEPLVVQRVLDLGYRNIHYEDGDKKQKPGCRMTSSNRPVILGDFEEAIRRGEVIIPWREAIQECYGFIRHDNGKLGAQEGTHDDRVIAMSWAWQMRKYAKPMAISKPINYMRGG